MATPSWPIRGAILFMGVLALGACGDSSPPSEPPGGGGEGGEGVFFRYAGTLTGRFEAAGPASDALDPTHSFAVAFRGEAGVLQLCAYQATTGGQGNFLLLSVGAADAPGDYSVPARPVAGATGWQPGTFLVGVDASRSSVAEISPFTDGSVKVAELSDTRVRGSFTITSSLSELTDGQFDVPMDRLANLPVICS